MADVNGRSSSEGVFFNASAERRAEFLACCGKMFSQLSLTDSVEATATVLGKRSNQLLVLDLNGHTQQEDLPGFGSLIRSRAGAAVLVLCAYNRSAWLPELMNYGPFDYRICPVLNDELQQAVKQALTVPDDPAAALQQQLQDKEQELRDLLGAQRSLQRALNGIDTIEAVSAQICLALCNFPGVRHASLLYLHESGDLQLMAQEQRNHLDVARLLKQRDDLLQSPLRDVFPPLVAADKGEMVLLDTPEKAGDPELAVCLNKHGVRMVLALPLRAESEGPGLGAICLMFDRQITFSREQFACLANLAQFISFGLGMSALKHSNDALTGQLSQLATIDALTGAVSRHAGEYMLEHEIRRARRYGLPLTALSFDVGSFHSENDIDGSEVGDQALRRITDIVRSRLRASDTLAHMRGQEFLIVATHTVAEDAMRLAEKLCGAVSVADLHCCLPGNDMVSLSLSVAEIGAEQGSATVLDRLDAARHRARRAGRNRIELAQ